MGLGPGPGVGIATGTVTLASKSGRANAETTMAEVMKAAISLQGLEAPESSLRRDIKIGTGAAK